MYNVHVQSNIAQPEINTELQLLKIIAQEHSSIYNNNNNNLYCALDTKSVKTLKGNNCEKREHSHSEIARANRAEWLGHAEK